MRIEYCMWVYVFGNCLLLVVVMYVLCKVNENGEKNIRDYVEWNFYVEDGLIFVLIVDEVIELMKKI